MALSLEQLPNDAASLKVLLLAVHADNALLTTNITQLTAERDHLQYKQSILAVLRRAHYGRSSERISDDQMQLALEDVEVGCAVEDAKVEQQHAVIKRSAALRGDAPIVVTYPRICREKKSLLSQTARSAPVVAKRYM